MTVHTHSVASFHTTDFNPREQSIIALLHRNYLMPLSDREIAQQLGFPDLNSVRPRITALVQRHVLVEGRSISCPVTGKTVRTVYLAAIVE